MDSGAKNPFTPAGDIIFDGSGTDSRGNRASGGSETGWASRANRTSSSNSEGLAGWQPKKSSSIDISDGGFKEWPSIVDSQWKVSWQRATEQVCSTYPTLAVQVCNPEALKAMLKKYVVYTVKTEPNGFLVKRRFSEFLWLRETLGKFYHGLFIPPLPQGAVLSNSTDVESQFIKNRTALLDSFINELLANPFLRPDPHLTAFLSMSSETDFKALMEMTSALTKASKSPVNDSIGLKLWKAMLAPVQASPASNETLKDLKRQVGLVDKSLAQLKEEFTGMRNRITLLAKDTSSMTGTMSVWCDVEKEIINPQFHHADCVIRGDNSLSVCMDGLVMGLGFWTQQYKLLPRIVSGVLLDTITMQIVQVEGFKEYLKERDALQAQLEKAEAEKVKLLEDKQKEGEAQKPGSRFSLGKFLGKGESLDESLQKKEDEVSALRGALNMITSAMVFCEVERFHLERSTLIKVLLGELVEANVQIAELSAAKWRDIGKVSGCCTQSHEVKVAALLSAPDETDAVSTRASEAV
jgi:hypothetical protein